MLSRPVLLCISLLFAACATSDGEPESSDEPEDYEVDADDGKGDGISATFDRSNPVPEIYFVDNGTFDADEVQTFLEQSPYHNRSWLADYRTPDGKRASEAIFDAATNEGIHPIQLLARMQGESSLVSKTSRPSASKINKLMGCGCPDGGGCASQYRGFEKQLSCSAKTLRRWYDASESGTGQWRVGRTTRTLDSYRITPTTHATASIYQYTPWVMPGRGGAWLLWNVTRKYVRHAEARGFLAD